MKLEGFDDVLNNLTRYGKKFQEQAAQAINATAQDVRNDAIRSIQRGTKSGNMYGNHRASAPGEAPATDTGRLVTSIHQTKIATAADLEANVIADTNYAKDLEFGTRDMEARPFMVPAMEKNRNKYDDRLRRVHDAAVKEVRQ